jgi:NAD(P)-dependent dehydrogenase (short-subunit alcohol dehydrogenase family)
MKPTALVTGGTRGIGFATATKLAERGFRVVVTGRSAPAAEDAARSIAAAVAGAETVGMALDLSSLARVREAADRVVARGPLQLLVNNAGQLDLDPERHVTADGIESTLATNAIGPFLFTRLVLGALQSGAPARIVNVGSRLHLPGSAMTGEVHWDWADVHGERAFDPVVAYKNSKLATMWFTYELARRLAGKPITVNAVCPGFVPQTLADHKSGLSRFVYKHVMPHLPGTRSVEQAAANTVFAATDPAYATRTGVFIGEEAEVDASEQARDVAEAVRFWKLACELSQSPDWP